MDLKATVQDLMDTARKLRHAPSGEAYDAAWNTLQDKLYAAMAEKVADDWTARYGAATVVAANQSVQKILGIEPRLIKRFVVTGIPVPYSSVVEGSFEKAAAKKMNVKSLHQMSRARHGLASAGRYNSSYVNFAWALVNEVLGDLRDKAEAIARTEEQQGCPESDKWNCKYCRQNKTCQLPNAVMTIDVSQPPRSDDEKAN